MLYIFFWGGFSSFWNENTNSVNDKIRKDDNINSITSINVFHIEFDLLNWCKSAKGSKATEN